MKDDVESRDVDVWRRKRDALKSERLPLSRQFDRNPNDIRLALRIKAIDDEIAKCTERITADNKQIFAHKLG